MSHRMKRLYAQELDREHILDSLVLAQNPGAGKLEELPDEDDPEVPRS